VTVATSRLLQLGALAGAVAVGAGVYVFIGGLAGGLYAAAALVFGLFAHAKLSFSGEPAPKSAEPHWNRWGRSRAQLEDLQLELDSERARVAEQETYVAMLRRDLEEERLQSRAREKRYLHELAELESAHAAEIEQISAGLAELEEQLTGFESIVERLRTTDSPHEGASFPSF
jgi:hypothetical protein